MPPRGEREFQPQAEHAPGLILIPIFATAAFYALPLELQARPAVQFLPQLLAYLCLTLWALRNNDVLARLGLTVNKIGQGIRWGLPVGLGLGLINIMVILWLIPRLGGDILFLQDTPHARLPFFLMLPWFILFIAFGVELNFRGFVLGRLQTVSRRCYPDGSSMIGDVVAVLGSALTFSFDPFMVATFQHLHWIAVWDGLAWGMIWIRLRNLYATIIAHAIEVMAMYTALKLILQ